MVTLGGKMRNDRKLKSDANSDSNGNAHGPKMAHQWSGRGVFSGSTHATAFQKYIKNIVLDESTQFSLVMSSTWWAGWIAPTTSGKKERQMDKTWQNWVCEFVWPWHWCQSCCISNRVIKKRLFKTTIIDKHLPMQPDSLTVNAHLHTFAASLASIKRYLHLSIGADLEEEPQSQRPWKCRLESTFPTAQPVGNWTCGTCEAARLRKPPTQVQQMLQI